MSTGEFEFVIQDEDRDWHRLGFRIYDQDARPWFSSVWQRMAAALDAAHKQIETELPEWVQWKPWDWSEKKRPQRTGHGRVRCSYRRQTVVAQDPTLWRA